MQQLLYILSLLIFFSFPPDSYSRPEQQQDDAQEIARQLFSEAQSFENAEEYQVALKAYEEIYSRFTQDAYGEESLFKQAVLLDEKLFSPSEAIDIYQQYLEKYPNSRHSHRAEIRINALKRYKDINQASYKEFNTILNSYHLGENPEFTSRLEKFISDYPEYKALDDALFWLANEYRGRQRIPTTKAEFANIEKAIPIYKRILEEYPDSPHKIMVLKNIGDCHYLLKSYGKAQDYYNLVRELDAGFADRLIGNDLMRTEIRSYRYNGFIVSLITMIGSLVVIIKFIPLNKMNPLSGIKTGLFHALFFIPAAIILPGLTFYLTDAKHDNMTGMEPWLMTLIMGVTLFFILLNGLVMELDSRVGIKMKYYLPSLIVLHLSITYILFYSLGLMTYIERLVI